MRLVRREKFPLSSLSFNIVLEFLKGAVSQGKEIKAEIGKKEPCQYSLMLGTNYEVSIKYQVKIHVTQTFMSSA